MRHLPPGRVSPLPSAPARPRVSRDSSPPRRADQVRASLHRSGGLSTAAGSRPRPRPAPAAALCTWPCTVPDLDSFDTTGPPARTAASAPHAASDAAANIHVTEHDGTKHKKEENDEAEAALQRTVGAGEPSCAGLGACIMPIPLSHPPSASAAPIDHEGYAVSHICSVCGEHGGQEKYSTRQLKRGANRVCRVCVSQGEARQEAEAQAAAQVVAADAAIQQRVPHEQSVESPPSARCVVCKQVCVRRCDLCAGACCSERCLQVHSQRSVIHASSVCDTYRTMPPRTMHTDDLLSKDDIVTEWKRIQRQLRSTPDPSPSLRSCRHIILSLSGSNLASALLPMYPPRMDLNWWTPGPTSDTIFDGLNVVVLALIAVAQVHSGELSAGDRTSLAADERVTGKPDCASAPAVFEQTRLIHKIIQLLRYMYTHAKPECIPADVRPYVNVNNQHYGEGH